MEFLDGATQFRTLILSNTSDMISTYEKSKSLDSFREKLKHLESPPYFLYDVSRVL